MAILLYRHYFIVIKTNLKHATDYMSIQKRSSIYYSVKSIVWNLYFFT